MGFRGACPPQEDALPGWGSALPACPRRVAHPRRVVFPDGARLPCLSCLPQEGAFSGWGPAVLSRGIACTVPQAHVWLNLLPSAFPLFCSSKPPFVCKNNPKNAKNNPFFWHINSALCSSASRLGRLPLFPPARNPSKSPKFCFYSLFFFLRASL